jgi:spore coat protein CotH
MKLRGLALAILLILTLVPASPANSEANANGLFANDTVNKITISVSGKSAAKLGTDPKTDVAARFNITGKGFKFQNVPVGLHLKGTSTLRANPSLFNNRPSLRVKFQPDGVFKLPFLGSLESLTLNAMTQDESKIHEYSAYTLYNAMGVPAPRVSYASVTVVIDGRKYQKGLFAIIEPYEDAFLADRFETNTQHVYEPCGHWIDITRPGAGKGGKECSNSLFEVKEGWKNTPNKNDLKALIAAQKTDSNKQWWINLDRYFDRDALIRMWAVDNFIGAWDSYSGAIINNYYLRSDRMGVFTMMPTGTDESFVYNFAMDARSIGYPLIYDNFQIQSKNRGYLFSRCLTYKPCRNEYLDQLKVVSQTAKEIKLTKIMQAASDLIADYAPNSAWAGKAAQNWVNGKHKQVTTLLRKYGR